MNWFRSLVLRWLFPPRAPGVDWHTVNDAAESARARGERELVESAGRWYERQPDGTFAKVEHV